ncbi:potassium voltage-gated channel subfamily H member 6 isoform X3, partial [Brachionus plicatilis]
LISAAIFGNVTTIMIRMYQGTEELTEMQESVKDFIKFHTIPKSLSKRMQESFEHTWSFTNGIDMNTVLKSFPESLQADICLHLNRQLLNNCQAFQDASEGCLRMLALQFKSTHVPPGDTLIHKGDNLNSIYFIARGTLEIVSNNQAMAILDKNDIFGENIGKYQERDVMGRSSCDVRALAYCDLHKIDRCDLLDVLEMYPDFAESFEKKFQVTFDLRECELNESKPRKKKSNRTIRNLLVAANKNRQIGRKSSFNTTNSNLALICENEAKNQNQNQIQNLDNLATINRKSINSGLNFNPSLSASLNAPNDSNLLQISPTRKIIGSFQRKNKLRSTSRLSPMVFSSELSSKRNSCVSNNSLPKRKIVSSYADVDTEIQCLLEKVSKTEESIKNQMDMLTNFLLNYVINDSSCELSNSNKFA